MAEYMVTDTDMKSVADAIRTKGGTTAPLAFPDGMKQAITDIPKAKPEQAKSITITQNGETIVKPDAGKVLSQVTVTTNTPAGADISPFKAIQIVQFTGNGTDTATFQKSKPELFAKHVMVVCSQVTPTMENVVSTICASTNTIGYGVGNGATFCPWEDMNLGDTQAGTGAYLESYPPSQRPSTTVTLQAKKGPYVEGEPAAAPVFDSATDYTAIILYE